MYILAMKIPTIDAKPPGAVSVEPGRLSEGLWGVPFLH